MAVSLAELMANNTPQPWTRAGGALTNALFGSTEPARQKGYTHGLRMASLLEAAKRKRDENLGFAKITPELIARAQTDPTARAELASVMEHAGRDPQQVSGYQLDQTQNAGLAGIPAAYEALGYTKPQADLFGALAAANRGKNIDNDVQGAIRSQIPLAGTANVPQDDSPLMHALGLKTTDVSNGVAYNPMATPDDQTITPTAVGNAAILADKAMANERNAHAGLYDKQTSVGGYNPNTGRGGNHDGVRLPTGVDPGAVTFARHMLAQGSTPDQVRDFLISQGRKATADYMFAPPLPKMITY